MELGTWLEQTFLLEAGGYLLDEISTGSGEVGQGGHDPNGRSPKGENADELDAVAGGPPQKEVPGEFSLRGIGVLDFAHLLDEEAQGGLHHGLVDPGAADSRGKRGLADFPDEPRCQGSGGPQHAFRQGEQVFREGIPHLRIVTFPAARSYS